MDSKLVPRGGGPGRCTEGTPQHPGLGAARSTEEKAFGLMEVEHSSWLAAGFDKVMGTVRLISNEGDEGIQAVSDPALPPLLGGSARLSSPHGSGGGREGGKLTDKGKVRSRKMLGMCFLI